MTFYYPSTPGANDRFRKSYREFRSNFQQINEVFQQNHVSLINDDADKRGKHSVMKLIEQGSDPTTAASERAWYTKDNSGVTDLYMRGPSSGTVVQLTSGPRLATGVRLEAWAIVNPVYTNATTVESFALATQTYTEVIEGEEVTTTRNLASPNVSETITKLTGNAGRINFTSSLSTADYFWDVQSPYPAAMQLSEAVRVDVQGAASYATSVTADKFEFAYKAIDPLESATFEIPYIFFKFYTVVP